MAKKEPIMRQENLARNYYSAAYDGLVRKNRGSLNGASVYWDGTNFYASSSGCGHDDVVSENIDISEYGEFDIAKISERDFVDGAMYSFGIPSFVAEK